MTCCCRVAGNVSEVPTNESIRADHEQNQEREAHDYELKEIKEFVYSVSGRHIRFSIL